MTTIKDLKHIYMPSPKRFPERFPETYDELYRVRIFPKRLEDVQEKSPYNFISDCDWRIKRTFEQLLLGCMGNNIHHFAWLENDLKFGKCFVEFAPQIVFPEDWDIIHFGGVLAAPAKWATNWLVTGPMIHGFQFVIFRARCYRKLLEAVRAVNDHPLDDAITRANVKQYLVHPNLVWQRDVESLAERSKGKTNSEAYDPETGESRINPQFYTNL